MGQHCDLCKRPFTPEEVDSPAILKVKHQIFCEACRPKVLAAIEKKKAQAGAATDATKKPAEKSAPKVTAPKRSARKPAVPQTTGEVGSGRPGTRPPSRPAPPRRAPRRRTAAGDSPSQDEASPAEFRLQRRSNTPLIVTIVVLGAIGLGLVIVVVSGSAPEGDRAASAPPSVDPAVSRRLANEAKAQEGLEQVLAFQKQFPEHYQDCVAGFSRVAQMFPGTSAGQEAAQKSRALQDTWRAEVQKTWSALEAEIEGMRREKRFAAAFERLQELPSILRGSQAEEAFDELRKEIKLQRDALVRLNELRGIAIRYLTQEDDAIAVYVLKEFASRYEHEAPLVWDLQQESIALIETEPRESAIEKLKKLTDG